MLERITKQRAMLFTPLVLALLVFTASATFSLKPVAKMMATEQVDFRQLLLKSCQDLFVTRSASGVPVAIMPDGTWDDPPTGSYNGTEMGGLRGEVAYSADRKLLRLAFVVNTEVPVGALATLGEASYRKAVKTVDTVRETAVVDIPVKLLEFETKSLNFNKAPEKQWGAIADFMWKLANQTSSYRHVRPFETGYLYRDFFTIKSKEVEAQTERNVRAALMVGAASAAVSLILLVFMFCLWRSYQEKFGDCAFRWFVLAQDLGPSKGIVSPAPGRIRRSRAKPLGTKAFTDPVEDSPEVKLRKRQEALGAILKELDYHQGDSRPDARVMELSNAAMSSRLSTQAEFKEARSLLTSAVSRQIAINDGKERFVAHPEVEA